MTTLNKTLLIASLFFSGLSYVNLSYANTNIELYKSPSCGCCTQWANIMQDKGYQVDVQPQKDWSNVRSSFGLTPQLQSCHSAIVDGYLIEGHVPEQDIARLLKERPQGIKGLAVPGMPMHSPGMAKEGQKYHGFDVIAFYDDGTTQVYHSYSNSHHNQ
ncbi:CopG family transcriptional regulator [Vibrio sp. UCD-FRSSP16_10]|uniref:DUF411 domain-containing protein n=1 Tax=unclassified Vibrio TaxID=2614977 RepID=UPI000800960B|nr:MULTISPECIES: DUF411 domain-containing protein [unclassified Vibrio]OBT13414.1 CopG family transcriptional regulator [Vibrio sp. UCD-FRSSP16_10]OBT17924.1 CopG family transcriptional regulator [Vibrio sp. UCD-FRSSP16_30]